MNRRAMMFAWALLPLLACAADAPREIHGSGDRFGAPGVALAWGVLRGANEAATVIVVRVETDVAVYPWLAAVGIDPFTKAQRNWQDAGPITGRIDVRIPRAQFGDFPRTEFRFYPSATAAQTASPSLVVFYHGAPDTTPEFVDAARLEAHLAMRIAEARAASGKPP